MPSLSLGRVVLRVVLFAIVGRMVVVSCAHFRSDRRNPAVTTATISIKNCPRCGSSPPQLVNGLDEEQPASSPQRSTERCHTAVMTVQEPSWSVGDDCLDDQQQQHSTPNVPTILMDRNITLLSMEEAEASAANRTHRGSRRRKLFLKRIANVSSLLLRREHDASLEEEEALEMHDPEWGNAITPQSDLTRPGRHVHIVTTASLPWFTGTAVNPLLRAAYLHRRLHQINADANMKTTKSSYVTLVIPWLELPEDQEQVYHNQVFESPAEQEAYVRDWLRNQAGMSDAADNVNIVFYSARYHAGLGSVFAMGDIIEQLPPDELDVCILEEPEQ